METVNIQGNDYPTIDKPLFWHVQGLTKTATGYGTKIETSKCVKFAGKVRRIYCDVYSNSGVTYVIVNGAKIYCK